jgi:hypothetical protein
LGKKSHTWEHVGLGEYIDKIWEAYIEKLKYSNVKIREHDNYLLWYINHIETYMLKLRYRALVEEGLGEKQAWWRIIWKIRSPSKSKFFI